MVFDVSDRNTLVDRKILSMFSNRNTLIKVNKLVLQLFNIEKAVWRFFTIYYRYIIIL